MNRGLKRRSGATRFHTRNPCPAGQGVLARVPSMEPRGTRQNVKRSGWIRLPRQTLNAPDPLLDEIRGSKKCQSPVSFSKIRKHDRNQDENNPHQDDPPVPPGRCTVGCRFRRLVWIDVILIHSIRPVVIFRSA